MKKDLPAFGGLGGEEAPNATKKKVRRVSDLDLPALYERVVEAKKATPSIRSAIIAKEDFTKIQPHYCGLCCNLASEARRPGQARIQSSEADIVILQDHNALPDKYKSSSQQEKIYRDILGFMATKYFQGLSYTVLNVLKCLPDAKDVKGQSVTITKAKPCSAYLLQELKSIKPKAIIALTANSLKVLGLKLTPSSNRGEFYATDLGPVVVTLHPKVLTMIRQNASGKSWGPDYFEVLERDFHKAARIARGDLKIVSLEEALQKASRHIRIARSMDDVREMMSLLDSLDENKIVSFDLETTGLDAWAPDAKIITAQFGYTDPETGEIEALVFPLWHRANTWYDPAEAWELIAPILRGKRPKVGHNIKFDIIYTYVCTGVRLENVIFDTMLLLHAINSGIKGNYGLKRGVWDFLPETGLGGYEDKLPALTKGVDEEDEETGEEGED